MFGNNMGYTKNITAFNFPKQSEDINKRCKVLFHYQDPEVYGTIIRSDSEDPWQTIIQLDDGRIILATECQYSPEHPNFPVPPKRVN